MPGVFTNIIKGTPKAGITLFGAIKKYWYFLILFIVIMPSVINSIKIANETDNWTYPFFDLGTRLITADQVLEKDVITLQTNPSELIGQTKPNFGFLRKIKYYWSFWWNGIYRIIGNVWLIFFPLVILFKIIHNSGNKSMPARNLVRALFWFIVYLFFINAVMIMHGVIVGNTLIVFPEGTDTMKEYMLVIWEMIPFRGLYALGKYLVSLAI